MEQEIKTEKKPFTAEQKAAWMEKERIKRELKIQQSIYDADSRSMNEAKEHIGMELWFPNFLDGRGRIYYRGAYLQPQSQDTVKGLMNSSKRVPLGERGFQWLAWHVATTYGFDKLGFDARVNWTMDRVGALVEMVASPDKHELFLEADQQSLFLYAANEFVNALTSGAPFEYATDCMIGMDATSSGLQFLSAIALDAEGGKKVNLITSKNQEAKADIYMAAVTTAMANIKINTGGITREWLMKHPITRNMAKRPVMTLPYSAGESSARDYVLDEMIACEYPLPSGEEAEEMRKQLCEYFGFKATTGQKVDAETGEVFVSDYWLRLVLAQFIARELREACAVEMPAAMKLLEMFKKMPELLQKQVDWYTPDGFNAVNEYVETVSKQLWYEQNKDTEARIRFEIRTEVPDYIKAGNGMSPNFIHSLDANLVREVVRRVDFDGIYIHDQFMCHPSNADAMFMTIKEAFIDLIKTDPLGQLLMMHGLDHLKDELMLNTLDLEEVLESEFIFC